MKAVVFHDIGNISLENVSEPTINEPRDAIVRLTKSAICGTDLHFIRGTMSGMKSDTILGHEGIGIVERVGEEVRNLAVGDRVVIPSTIACGYCSYCRDGYFAQCDNANPNGNRAGTSFYGGPAATGSFNGMQAEKVRVPFANAGLVKLPDEMSDEQAIFLSDILPTAFFGAELAQIRPGNTVAILGCGPVGLLAIACAFYFQAGRVIAVDTIPSRLKMAQGLGAEVIDYNKEDPVESIVRLTGGIGVDRAIDAVGVDAQRPHDGPAAKKLNGQAKQFDQELEKVAPQTNPEGANWHPGDGPSQALIWAVDVLAKAGTISIIGVYPPQHQFFPLGIAMNKNITMNMGNCNHRKYIPQLIPLIMQGALDPAKIITQEEPLTSVIDAYKSFDTRKEEWVKVILSPAM